MRVLVAGGSGRIGGYVLRDLLQFGHEVTSLGRSAPLVEGAAFAKGDLLDTDTLLAAFKGQDAVILLSAVAHPRWATADRLRQVNVIGTYNALDAAVARNVPKVVFASSGAAFGYAFSKHELAPRYFPVDEEHPSEPEDEYGLSKVLGETICKSYSDAYGIQTICLRITAVMPLDRPGAEVLARSGAYAAKPVTVEAVWGRYSYGLLYPDGPFHPDGLAPPSKNFWTYTDARDCAQAFRLAVEGQQLQHEVILPCADDIWSLSPTADLIARYYPNVPLRGPLEGNTALFSLAKANQLLRYQPKYRWRETDFGEWFAANRDKLGSSIPISDRL